MSSKPIGEALRDEAHRKLMTGFELKDWQLGDPSNDLAIVEPSRKMSITVEDDRISIFSGDETSPSVWLELNNGELTIHAYDKAHEEPVILRIGDIDIEIENYSR